LERQVWINLFAGGKIKERSAHGRQGKGFNSGASVHLAAEEGCISGHVQQSVAREVEGDDLLLVLLLSL
jgi:hypothetical protein